VKRGPSSHGGICQDSSRLITPENSSALDKEASASWGLDPFALVEAAGRACAFAMEKELPDAISAGPLLVCAGSGNNGADAMVMLRVILMKNSKLRNATVLLSRFPAPGENNPRSEAIKALQMMGVPVIAWNGIENTLDLFRNAALIIDGIAGTGISGALEGIPLEMVTAINEKRNTVRGGGSTACREGAPLPVLVVSIDVPSGGGSGWKPAFPVIHADYTLAVEPLKTVLYTPALRPCCGKIIPVRGIFPQQLLARYGDAELLRWEDRRAAILPVPPDAYKYRRGVVEIHAGSTGSAGAARIAAAGASAAGAGLVRLVVDDSLYPILAPSLGGSMAVPASTWSGESAVGKKSSGTDRGRFKPDAFLLGPGWGRGTERRDVLRQALEAEKSGIPLVLDADGIALLKDLFPENHFPVFHGRAILTPHAGELEELSGIPKERLLSEPGLIAELAEKMNAVILFKSHVMILAGPDGRLGFIDGMDPSLGAGGSGDLLAGLCAGIAGRTRAADSFDPYAAAAAAGTLLVAASRRIKRRFYDPLELAQPAAALAGRAWLPHARS